jgi:hypothetical protein
MSVLRPALYALLVVLAAAIPAAAADHVLSVEGKAASMTFTMADLDALPQAALDTTTPWTNGMVRFSGPLVRDVLARSSIAAKSFRAIALNDYAIAVPASDFARHDVILATRMDGREMPVREKGPLWIVYPDANGNHENPVIRDRMVWQLKALVAQ